MTKKLTVTFGVRVPDYEVEKVLWFDKHYEGGYLFRNALVIELVPPQNKDGEWHVKYAWQGQTTQSANKVVDTKELTRGRVEVTIPFDSGKDPGVAGRLRFVLSAWNE